MSSLNAWRVATAVGLVLWFAGMAADGWAHWPLAVVGATLWIVGLSRITTKASGPALFSKNPDDY